MIAADPIVADAQAVDETKAYLRIGTGDEDALLARLVAIAIGHGETVTGQILVMRGVRETVAASCAWRRLGRGPVTAVGEVAMLPPTGDPVVLTGDAFAIDIDAAGDGWVRLTRPGTATRLTVRYTAGIASAWSALPEPLRQGAVRLASHLYTHRDAEDERAPPAAIAALWRPWRRMRMI